jgi:hypothetical protein
MATSPTGLGPENDCAGESQYQLQTADPSSRQRGRPKSTNPQLSDNNKDLVVSPRWVFIPKQTGRLPVGRNIRLRLNSLGFSRKRIQKLSVQLWSANQRTTEAKEVTDS